MKILKNMFCCDDLNVPLKNGFVADETRIDKIIPIINLLIKKNQK